MKKERSKVKPNRSVGECQFLIKFQLSVDTMQEFGL